MHVRPTVAGLTLLLLAILLIIPRVDLRADPPPIESFESEYNKVRGRGEKGITEKYTGVHVYWKDGLHLDGRRKNFTIRIGGRVLADGGNIDANDELQAAFPGLDGYEADFRSLRISASGTIRALSAIKKEGETSEGVLPTIRGRVTSYAPYDVLEFKFQIEFANVQEIKDNWVRFPRIPFLRHLRFGHLREPFSLEDLTPLTNTTFMERALPNQAFAIGRNMGIRYDKAILDERMTVGAGWFLNTGSFEDVGEATDRISEANGFNITARVTGLPWYDEEAARLLHLGLSYSHGVRDDKDEDDSVGFRTRPETLLTDDRLVDTGGFLADRLNRINPELAIVSGPLSFQAQYFHTFTNADDEGDPDFWGFYVYGSYFFTGENRSYDTSTGSFSRVKPERNFHPLQGGWGALELGLRYSFIDLNDEAIKGGKESNFTAGLNWYLNARARFMLNYIYANAKDRGTPPEVDNGRANIVQARFQIAY